MSLTNKVSVDLIEIPQNEPEEAEKDFWSYHKKLVCIDSSIKVNENFADSEFNLYLQEPVIDLNANPIKFWKSRNSSSLSAVALKYLSMIAKSLFLPNDCFQKLEMLSMLKLTGSNLQMYKRKFF